MKILPAILAAALSLGPVSFAQAQSIEEMAGQMIIVGFKGDGVGDASVKALSEDIANGVIGGVMYLKTNVASTDAVRDMNAMFVSAAPDGRPPFITIDQEGGLVERLTKAVGFAEVPSAADVAASRSPEEARSLYEQMAAGIADLGFTVNFGPVADIDLNSANEVIGKFGRAFGKDATTVAAYDKAFIAAHRDAGVLTALKHFPGHGSSSKDSHKGFVDITATWKEIELEPYQALFDEGYRDFVMVGHLYHAAYTEPGEELPASLTNRWIELTLKQDMNFKGLVISDDLEMGAIRQRFSLKDTVIKAVWAGMDVLLFSNTAQYDPALGKKIRDILVAEAAADPTFATRIGQSYRRIVETKERIR